MDFSTVELTDKQAAFAAEARAFFDEYVTQDVHDEELRTGNGFDPRVYLGLGERGWLFPDWPVSEGGAGLDPVEKRLLELEKARSQYIDITSSTTHLVWSAVERYLDPALLAEMKPKVASGHVRFCLGYTDPNGGSDIANSTLRAVQDGDEWVLNGSKIFTTGAQQTQYTFLITRTDPDLPKHKGLTMFLVPLDTPGIEGPGDPDLRRRTHQRRLLRRRADLRPVAAGPGERRLVGAARSAGRRAQPRPGERRPGRRSRRRVVRRQAAVRARRRHRLGGDQHARGRAAGQP